jgi:hypothetical protein
MISMPSNTLTSDVSFSQRSLLIDTITEVTIGNDGSCNKENETWMRLHGQPRLNSSNKWQPIEETTTTGLDETADPTTILSKDTSDRLPQRVITQENSETPLTSLDKKQRESMITILGLTSNVVIKRHRRSNACISLDRVLECPLVVSLLIGYHWSNPKRSPAVRSWHKTSNKNVNCCY